METDGGGEELRPPILQLSAEKLNRYGVYLMDYGLVSPSLHELVKCKSG